MSNQNTNLSSFEIKCMVEKFENLLANDRIFVEYLNEFLLLPSFNEKLKFNFETGELEMIEEGAETDIVKENDANESKNSHIDIKKRIINRSASTHSSRAENMKKNLEFQLKNIVETHRNDDILNKCKSASVRLMTERAKLAKGIHNHSFKDLDIVPIRSILQPTDLKDPKAAYEAKIPVIKTKYDVKVLKKPQSINWLRVRRLTLFLQSSFYSEYKLAKLLSQCRLNASGTPNVFEKTNAPIRFVKVEIDQEMDEMKLNPFKAKNDLQKLREFNGNDNVMDINEKIRYENKKSEEKEKQPDKKTKIKKNENKVSQQKADESGEGVNKSEKNSEKKPKKQKLFENDEEIFRSIKYDNFHTSLLYSSRAKSAYPSSEIRQHDSSEIETIKTVSNEELDSSNESDILSVDKMATNLADNILNEFYNDLREDKPKKVAAKQNNTKLPQIEFEDDEYNDDFEDSDDDTVVEVEFEDESFNLKQSFSDSMKYNMVRKEHIENFKHFIKDSDAELYYKLWVDIEKLNLLTSTSDRINMVKELKMQYNRPDVLKKINSIKTFAKMNPGQDFWSFENLVDTVQDKLMNSMLTYWFPKYLIHSKSKGETHFDEYTVFSNTFIKRKPLNDLQVENIEKSLKLNEEKTTIVRIEPQSGADKNAESEREKRLHIRELYKKRMSEAKSAVNIRFDGNYYTAQATDDETQEPEIFADNSFLSMFETSPPVGLKRPKTHQVETVQTRKNQEQINREIYLEAISYDDAAGYIFMKYLQSINKTFALNRLKCLYEIIKYKELFYDDGFNQDMTKKIALDIYTKYISITALQTIDCDKTDRLKIHSLLYSENNKNYVNFENDNKPVYEDMFDIIEEFICENLYDEWKNFMNTENSYFNKIEMARIERSIRIKSRRIEELKKRGLIKFAQIEDPYSFTAYVNEVRESEKMITTHSSQDLSEIKHDDVSYSLSKFVKNKRDLQNFKEYLGRNNALNDLLCWMDIETYTCIPEKETSKTEFHATVLKKKYLNKKYLFGPNSPLDEETQNMILENIGGWNVILLDRPPNSLIMQAKKHVQLKLEDYWLPKYFSSDFYAKIKANVKSHMADVVDDVLHLKTRSSSNVRQTDPSIRNRWLFSSQSIINFRKALKNPFTVKLFNKYLEMQSKDETRRNRSLLSNNLQFLLDVQDYKELCLKQADEQTLIAKVQHIIDSYIDCRLPPKIQISISDELADKIIEEHDYISPYLFLEANLTIFYELLPFWLQFDHMRSIRDMDLLHNYSGFKRLKDYNNLSRTSSSLSMTSDGDKDGSKSKWRYNQYMKALKTQMILS